MLYYTIIISLVHDKKSRAYKILHASLFSSFLGVIVFNNHATKYPHDYSILSINSSVFPSNIHNF